MILNANTRSNYPFIESSTLSLGSGLEIPAGTIYGAKLYPKTAVRSMGRLYIGGMEPSTVSGSVGRMIIVSTVDPDLQITTEFHRQADALIGVATQNGIVCGCIKAGVELAPILSVKRILSPDAFVFTPSVYCPIFSDMVGEFGNEQVNDLFSTSYRPNPKQFTEKGTILKSIDELRATMLPIYNVELFGNSLEAKPRLYIRVDSGSRLRIAQSNNTNTIEVGCERDYQTG